ncbi:L,D-transpeptidase [Paludibacterium purpuratum]|uniref:Lipoprotein-anchoring transpeptidase ErfK/SrfK n=1 Tax=Paludibacterium purpuratum TaxID=1144873 RepID=A0A4R7B1G5_9NEIS|nr:L,D-transpeptidase [Paludibacterium purpuratum]TDR73612.1 lipoprotein-anchoring transpeptidase ErfK/SrfK [Paludibacterium purpuratum]
MKWCACWLIGLLPAVAMAEPPPQADYVLWAQSAPVIPLYPNPHRRDLPWLRVSVAEQSLTLYDGMGRAQRRYKVSTAVLGTGSQVGSYQTPLGWHQVCAKIGDDAAPDNIIYRRVVTAWHYTPALHEQYPDRDWILARILWLCGMEPGKNLGGDVDSHDRAIYIHGAGSHVAFGTPTSHGCVRMSVDDVVELYRQVPLGTDVVIEP